MKRAVFVVLIVCLSLALLTGVAAGGGTQPTAKFPAGAKLTVKSVPPFFWTFSWPAASGTFDAYRLDLVKTNKPAATYSFNAGTALRFTVETVSGEGYPYCKAGTYTASVSVLSKGVVCDTLAFKGALTLK
ncbi:MAG: hypothetical protein NTW58_00410 [Actinobacteria bacterium]|nr:hypothetical protein [Actinomycetota bacterium]